MNQFNLNLTEAEVNYVLSTLQDKPFKEVVGLIDKIMKQANEQLVAPQAPEVPTEEA